MTDDKLQAMTEGPLGQGGTHLINGLTAGPQTAESERVGLKSSPRFPCFWQWWTLAIVGLIKNGLIRANAQDPSITQAASAKPHRDTVHVIIGSNHQTTFFCTKPSDLETESTSIRCLTCSTTPT
jgi:hypothetical protein